MSSYRFLVWSNKVITDLQSTLDAGCFILDFNICMFYSFNKLNSLLTSMFTSSTYFIYLSGSDLIESIAFWTSKLRMFCSFIKSTKSSPLYIEMSFLMSSFSWRYCRVLLLLKPPLTDYLDPVFSSIVFFLEPVLLCSRCGLRFFSISSRLWRSSSIGSAGLFDLALVLSTAFPLKNSCCSYWAFLSSRTVSSNWWTFRCTSPICADSLFRSYLNSFMKPNMTVTCSSIIALIGLSIGMSELFVKRSICALNSATSFYTSVILVPLRFTAMLVC